MVVMWILTRKRNACALVKLSKETDIRVVRLIRKINSAQKWLPKLTTI